MAAEKLSTLINATGTALCQGIRAAIVAVIFRISLRSLLKLRLACQGPKYHLLCDMEAILTSTVLRTPPRRTQ